jgi:hypothetical protein
MNAGSVRNVPRRWQRYVQIAAANWFGDRGKEKFRPRAEGRQASRRGDLQIARQPDGRINNEAIEIALAWVGGLETAAP